MSSPVTTPSVKTPSRAFTYYIENLVVLSSGLLGSAFPETQGLPPVFEVKNKSEEELNELCGRSDNLLCQVLYLRGGGGTHSDDESDEDEPSVDDPKDGDFFADCEGDGDDDSEDDYTAPTRKRKHLKNITNSSKCVLCDVCAV